MKVLHISTWKSRCGIAGFTESVVHHLSRSGIESEICRLDPPALRNLTSQEFAGELGRFAQKARGCDLVHVQHEYSLFNGSGQRFDTISHFGRLLDELRQTGRPVVVTFHSGAPLGTILTPEETIRPEKEGGGIAAILRWGLQKVRYRRAVSELNRIWKKRVARHFDGRPGSFGAVVHTPRTRLELLNSGMAPASVSVVPLGCDLRDAAFFHVNQAAARERLRIPADAVLLTIFGFVAEYKGHLSAIKALRKLPPQYHLAIVGGPHPENRFDRTLNDVLAAWEGEDPGRLHVTGYVPRDVVDLYYAATDLCLAPFLPSKTAGSASLAWGLSSGKPTIASNIPAFAEIQEEGDCLLLCMPGAEHELAWQIQRLAGDRALQEKLSQKALQFAARQSWERVIERLITVYFDVLGENTTPRGLAGRLTSISELSFPIAIDANRSKSVPKAASTG